MAKRAAGRSLEILLGLAIAGGVGSVAVAACHHGLSLEEAKALAAPRAARFDALDRWVRRTVDSRVAFRTDELQNDIAFTPVRGSRDVLGAWVDIYDSGSGTRPRAIHYGPIPTAPSDLTWIELATPSLRVSQTAIPIPSGEPVRCDLLSRDEVAADGQRVVVTVAYHSGPSSPR